MTIPWRHPSIATRFSGTGRGLRLYALVLGLAITPPLLAQPLPFDGRWLLDAPPQSQSQSQSQSPAPYTALRIEGGNLTWRGPARSAPRCVQAFVPRNEPPGSLYLDGRGIKFVAGIKGSLPTYLLQLRSSTCGRAGEDTRISYPLVYDIKHIEVIEYVGGKPVSARRFRRLR
jgi:hypothetical protein